MRYRSCLAAVCLAVLPMQAYSQNPTQGSHIMEQISNRPKMRLWDELMEKRYQSGDEEARLRNQKFLDQAVPLGSVIRFNPDEIKSIRIYIINRLVSNDIPWYDPEWIKRMVPKERGSIGENTYYSIEGDADIKNALDILQQIKVVDFSEELRKISGVDDPYYMMNYRMTIEITNNDNKVSHLSMSRGYSAVYLTGSVIDFNGKRTYLYYGFRDLNIFIQSIDKDMFVFSEGEVLEQLELHK